ncbi:MULTISPECIES: aspartate aminotransferase family protein [unclassified Sinorhizobium]|uniref:aspartate aminotransferase family protein n=1 Tax=unclassified Sinorhizobium TaxID=2613772 RepID=UPI0024C2BB0B|nr:MULTISPECIES: aspartate aminotransferase family protein [unclassified Sinorhizobium]MDK1376796.1 aspartate aminotransferase family protein [Sinorhizobium sp. 6-70]MDK1479567.1 aspartate aminotransferase family protein [Sinorhizobium sp. 6-117]
MANTASVQRKEGPDHLFPCFRRADVAFTHGEGAWLYGADGIRYLDFATGIAVTGLGHSHPDLVNLLFRQGARLWHVSNAMRIPEQEALARLLCETTFADRVFFCNSGAEAVETAIKTARRFHFVAGAPERYRIATMEGAFHGRTLATIAAGGREKYLEGFGPPTPGFHVVRFGDIDSLDAACGPETAAILLEPIQGESGVRRLSAEDLARVRDICNRRGVLLIFDEVQTGIGRTGHLFAYQDAGVAPDLLATAKGLGNGFPLGACLATERVAASMTPGTHGSTFGGNPLAMVIAHKVVEIISNEAFLKDVRRRAARLFAGLEKIVATYGDVFAEVRGHGFLLGLRCVVPVEFAATVARANGLLSVTAGDNVLRLLPPLILSDAEIDQGLARLQEVGRSLTR